jgi:NTP pyrophosphatase (non-canonical NTP hydrolase)
MKYNEYSDLIQQTAIYPKEVNNFGVAYTFLGIFDELGEYREKVNLGDLEGSKKEKGDVLWYMCALCLELDISFTILIERYFIQKKEGVFEDAQLYFGNIKKYYRDGKNVDRNHMITYFFLPLLYDLLMDETLESLGEILQNNATKLLKRRETNTLHGDGDNRENENT